MRYYSLSLSLSLSPPLSYYFLFFKAYINYPTGSPRVCLFEKSEKKKQNRPRAKNSKKKNKKKKQSNRNKKDKKEWNNFSVLFLKEDVLLTQIH